MVKTCSVLFSEVKGFSGARNLGHPAQFIHQNCPPSFCQPAKLDTLFFSQFLVSEFVWMAQSFHKPCKLVHCVCSASNHCDSIVYWGSTPLCQAHSPYGCHLSSLRYGQIPTSNAMCEMTIICSCSTDNKHIQESLMSVSSFQLSFVLKSWNTLCFSKQKRPHSHQLELFMLTTWAPKYHQISDVTSVWKPQTDKLLHFLSLLQDIMQKYS